MHDVKGSLKKKNFKASCLLSLKDSVTTPIPSRGFCRIHDTSLVHSTSEYYEVGVSSRQRRVVFANDQLLSTIYLRRTTLTHRIFGLSSKRQEDALDQMQRAKSNVDTGTHESYTGPLGGSGRCPRDLCHRVLREPALRRHARTSTHSWCARATPDHHLLSHSLPGR